MEFTIHPNEKKRLDAWHEQHDAACPFAAELHAACEDSDFNPERFARFKETRYSFTLTGIGVAVDYRCRCGETVDITDVTLW